MARAAKHGGVRGGGAYFTSPRTHLEFIPSGCKVLDLVLGGGYAEGRVCNIIGDKSTGKTLLCIEASANFTSKYPGGFIWYREVESAFDRLYAEALGMPIERVNFGTNGKVFETVEDIFEDLQRCTQRCIKQKKPGLYIVDSLDALSDRAEMGRELDESSYGVGKAKQLSQMFRRIIRNIDQARMTVIIVSQVRSKIGLSFGRSTTRSGGRALDFYASQIVYLTHLKTLKRTVQGQSRPTGIEVRVRCDKNKIGLPYRECQFQIEFGYGIDDLSASVQWLRETGNLAAIGERRATVKKYLRSMRRADDREYRREVKRVNDKVERRWYRLERTFLPARRKYN